jgi:hemolysin activation/secretion protein
LKGLALLAALAAGVALVPRPAGAQDQRPLPDRPSDRPLPPPVYFPEEPPEGFELPPVEAPPPAPGPAGPPEFDVRGFAFEGNRVIATSALDAVAAPYKGRALSAAEIEDLRERLSRYYVERGYISSGALLDPDFFRDGVVHYRIVEGRLDEVRARGLGRLNERYVRERLPAPDRPLNVNDLQERFQMLLADPLFSQINARLQPGAAPGSAVLDMDVVRARPYDIAIYTNNYQPPSIGAEAVGVTGVVRNLTGLGDALDATLQHSWDKGGRYGLGWNLPVRYGTDLHLRVDRGESSVLEEPVASLGVDSVVDNYEVGIQHALRDTPRQRIALGLAYNYRDNPTELLGQPFSFVPGENTGTSIVRAWRFDQTLIQRWERQTLALRSTISSGSTNVNPDTAPADVVPARNYLTWLVQAQFAYRVLPNGASVVARGNLQWTDDRLVPLERIAIGGVSTVRGYPENTLVRDQGYSASLELRYPVYERPAERLRLTVIPFFDYGEAWNKGEPRQNLASIGLGLNLEWRGLFAELYYGHRLEELPGETSGNIQNKGVHFQVRYNL